MKTIQQFAVQFDPPTLLVEYKQDVSVYVRRIRIKQSNDWTQEESGPDHLAKRIIMKFPDLFENDHKRFEQLYEVLKIFQRSMKTRSSKATFSGKDLSMAQSLADIIHIDLNKCSDEVNERAKKIMDVEFEAKRLKPGDPGFVWDKSTTFNPPTETTDWDSDED